MLGPEDVLTTLMLLVGEKRELSPIFPHGSAESLAGPTVSQPSCWYLADGAHAVPGGYPCLMR